MIINCLALDDEPLALDVIEHHCAKIPFINLKARIRNPFEAIDLIQKGEIDLIFVDIQMPEMTGFELLRSVSKKIPVIFTTAYPEHALESYELDAFDYLLKPIPFDRFLRAVNKVKERLSTPEEHMQKIEPTSSHFIFVKTEYKTVKIFLSDILFIESMKDYVIFQLKNERISSLLSIKAVESFLPLSAFVRVHRSFIVAIDKISEIERSNITIEGKTIPIGENYRETFKSIIEQRRI